MPFTATSASFGTPPRDPINLDERYLVQLSGLKEKQMGSYDDPNVMEDKMIWTASVFSMAGVPIINAEGGIWTIDAISRVNVSPSKPGKPVAKARTYAEAFLGRDPKVAVDNGEDLMAVLLGRFAYALLDEKPRLDGGKNIVILKLTPVVDQKGAAAAVAAGIAGASLVAAGEPASLPF